jgi:CRISPR/Cas system endoribonuclease Cas6 (RAMP superfamily)
MMDMMKSVLYPDSREEMEWVSSKEGQNYPFFTMQIPEQQICENFGNNYLGRDENVDKIKIDPFAHLHLPARCILLAIIEESINIQHPNITFRTQSMLNDIKHDEQHLGNDGDIDNYDQHKLASELTESIAKRYENVPNYTLQHIFNSIATKINVENRYWDLDNIIENRLNLDQINLNNSQNKCENEPNKEVNPQNRSNSGTITPVSHIGWWKNPLSGTY